MRTYIFWSFKDFEIGIDLGQWVVGFNYYPIDYGQFTIANLFIGPIRLSYQKRRDKRRYPLGAGHRGFKI